MQSFTSRSTPLSYVGGLLLAYALVISLFAPFGYKPVLAYSAERNHGKENAASVSRKLMTPQRSGRRDGEVLVRFRGSASETEKDTIVLSHGARRNKKLRGESGIEKLELSAGQDVDTVAAQLRLNPAVELVEPNFLIRQDQLQSQPLDTNSTSDIPSPGRTGTFPSRSIWTSSGVNSTNLTASTAFLNPQAEPGPNDPRFSEQWALRNTGQSGGQFGSDIGATTAWQTTTGSQSTIIAIIDSGIDFTHPDLTNNQWINQAVGTGTDLHGWDYITGVGEIKDEQGHGTAIAGIIAAQGNNATGTTGVMWRASLMSLRVLDNTGTGDVANAIEAIDYAVAHGAQVINLSWGTEEESFALKDAIDRAFRHDVVVVCSAGNSGRDIKNTPYYPASFRSKDLISVASSDNFDRLTSWSNWSAKVTVAAPGSNILTTQMGGGYWTVTGTSASAPLVSGVAGLIKTVRPSLNANDVAKAITDNARQSASLLGKVASGGVVSASGALNALPRSSAGNGNGGSGAGGNNRNGNGNGQGRPVIPTPPPQRGSGGRGPGGSFNTTPPPVTKGAPGPNLPNLDVLRKARPVQPKARAPIQSNLPCLDCDPGGGGGGGGYYPPDDPDFSTARERPRNETGQPGVDLGSRNFNWGLPLVSLPGRAGLDLSLALFYNSLVWTKDGSYIKYNADLGSPAPGFHIGLPTLQQRFLDSQSAIFAYIMIAPSGGRVEMQQIGASSIYESQDGSYTQLDATNTSAPVVRTSDGTQLSFTAVTVNNEFRCTQIKDRNGNYISATYDSNNGHLLTLTDTLGRVVTFVYDVNNNLQTIRQTWAGVAHDWATFSYGSVWVAPAFGGGLLVNGPNNSYVTVLTQVNLQDGSYFTFAYNAAFGQVNRINHYAADGHLLAYASYNVDASAGQIDCPRFTERHDWAENWNNSAEAITTYAAAADNSWSKVTAPDGTVYKEFFATTGWQTGLTTTAKNYANAADEQADAAQKWTTTAWTQDDPTLSFQKNPRPTETNIYDAAGNRRRVTISYYDPASFSLPSDTYEYAADGVTLLRQTHLNYNLSATYTDRRIIGLVTGKYLFDGSGILQSFVVFDYDYGGGFLTDTAQPAVQHDAAYDLTFVAGRGNLSLVRQTDALDPINRPVHDTVFGYDTDGSPTFTTDPLWRQTSFSYTDSFSDGVNRNTFAFPTTETDADGFSSTAQYNYDFGAVTRKQDPKGAVVTMSYDSAGRPDRVTNQFNGAYSRWVYDPYGYVSRFDTIQDGAVEAYSVVVFDGAGRVRSTGGDLPNSTGGYRGQFNNYDVMGRLSQQTNPAEMNGGWAPVGDDAAGWVITYQSYDWKGRPLVTTKPDGTTTEASYGGCGCAGGEVTTVRDENGRRRRTTMDVLGRLKQVDELNWDQTVYAATIYTYNVRDQIISINQAGQIRSFTYDGYGRLQSRTTPEQGTTGYSYFADDTVQTVTDARGATTTFAYNNRGLVTGITYGVPAGVAATPNVSFGYDTAGNRTSMTDGLGSMSYSYNTLSQLTSETRTFNSLGAYTLSYAYNLAGELTSVTNPWNAQVGYNYDKVGRATGVSGSGYYGVTSYVNSISYRAFGLKGMSYANGRTLSINYDNKLRMTRWDVAGVLGSDYEYRWEDTFRPTFAHSRTDATLDRWYNYDNVGRLHIARSGSEARAAYGEPFNGQYDGPYSMGIYHDVWGNITLKEGWGGENPAYTATYTNNRRDGLQYDLAGNLTSDGVQTFTYDATGQQAYASGTGLTQSYDGNGLRANKIESGVATYYLRSSVLGGQVVAELNGSGVWTRGYVYLGGQLLAVQQAGVNWVHEDPVTKSKRVTDASGNVVSTVELDPWGGDTARSNSAAFQPRKYTSYERDGNGSDEAMMRRYDRSQSRFSQPDPYDGSYDLTDPQSFNRYSYVQNDPANFVDPSGLDQWDANPGFIPAWMNGWSRTTNPTEAFINYSQERTTAWHDFWGDSREYPWFFGGFPPFSFGPQNPTPNRNCIANAVAGGRVGDTRNIIPGAHGGNAHDGIHVEAGPGIHPVTALPAMAGRVLHAGPQDVIGTIGHNFSVVDILLNTRIDGQRYVMTLKDMGYDTGIRSGRVVPGRTIGSVEGSANPVGETGLHVTLMPLSVYNQYINGRFTGSSRSSVPVNQLMDAARDPRSPFRCP